MKTIFEFIYAPDSCRCAGKRNLNVLVGLVRSYILDKFPMDILLEGSITVDNVTFNSICVVYTIGDKVGKVDLDDARLIIGETYIEPFDTYYDKRAKVPVDGRGKK